MIIKIETTIPQRRSSAVSFDREGAALTREDRALIKTALSSSRNLSAALSSVCGALRQRYPHDRFVTSSRTIKDVLGDAVELVS